MLHFVSASSGDTVDTWLLDFQHYPSILSESLIKPSASQEKLTTESFLFFFISFSFFFPVVVMAESSKSQAGQKSPGVAANSSQSWNQRFAANRKALDEKMTTAPRMYSKRLL
jgi:hypothetical protein